MWIQPLTFILIAALLVFVEPRAQAVAGRSGSNQAEAPVAPGEPVLYRITTTPFLNALFDELIDTAKDPRICTLLAAVDSASFGVTANSPYTRCYKKLGSFLAPVETFGARGGLHEFYLVFGGDFPYKSWTNAARHTFLFADQHRDRADLLRSLVHEMSLSYDLKYDATMWGVFFDFGRPLDTWQLEFYRLWMKSPVVRIGLSVLRSEEMERLVLEPPKLRAKPCYEELEERLLMQVPRISQFAQAGDFNSHSSFSSDLARKLSETGLKKENEAVTASELTQWIKTLAKEDANEARCRFLFAPLIGSSPNFVAAGPRPGMGDGLAFPERPWSQVVMKELGGMSPVVGPELREELRPLRGRDDGTK
jgi:hypothetical protein